MTTRVVHCRREPYDVLIDRTTKWGNPFVVGKHGDRAQVIAKYEMLLALPRYRRLRAELDQLRGKKLGCWCAPLPCHGDVLARLADASISCPQCGLTSFHPKDVSERYCGNCHQFHDTMRPPAPPTFEPIETWSTPEDS